MISLSIAFAVLVAGYLIYSRVTQKVFDIDDRKTPAIEKNDFAKIYPEGITKAEQQHVPVGFRYQETGKAA
ncbi:MAG: hypothetical protein IJU84_00885 [Clostridia bacterium]|nr:hypothetical protein [Clostridia bacterium]